MLLDMHLNAQARCFSSWLALHMSKEEKYGQQVNYLS